MKRKIMAFVLVFSLLLSGMPMISFAAPAPMYPDYAVLTYGFLEDSVSVDGTAHFQAKINQKHKGYLRKLVLAVPLSPYLKYGKLTSLSDEYDVSAEINKINDLFGYEIITLTIKDPSVEPLKEVGFDLECTPVEGVENQVAEVFVADQTSSIGAYGLSRVDVNINSQKTIFIGDEYSNRIDDVTLTIPNPVAGENPVFVIDTDKYKADLVWIGNGADGAEHMYKEGDVFKANYSHRVFISMKAKNNYLFGGFNAENMPRINGVNQYFYNNSFEELYLNQEYSSDGQVISRIRGHVTVNSLSDNSDLAFKLGDTLEAEVNIDNENWDEDSPIIYTWYSNEQVIENATTNQYVLTPENVGKRISVEVSVPNKYIGTLESQPSRLIRRKAIAGAVAIIDDNASKNYIGPSYGMTIRAVYSIVHPDGRESTPMEYYDDLEEQEKVNFMWYVGDELVADASDISYDVRREDIGKKIRVEISYVDYAGTIETETIETEKSMLYLESASGYRYQLTYGKTLAEASIVAEDSVVVKVQADDNPVEGTWQIMNPNAVPSAGNQPKSDYWAIFKTKEESDYYQNRLVTQIPLEVFKAERSEASSTEVKIEANKQVDAYIYDLSCIEGVSGLEDIYFSNPELLGDGQDYIENASINHNTNKLQFNLKAVPLGKKPIIKITASSRNFEDFDVLLILTPINKEIVDIEGIRVEDKIYDKSPISYTGTPQNSKNIEGTYSYRYISLGEEEYVSEDAPKDAGTYALEVTFTDDSGQYIGKKAMPFTIGKKAVFVKPVDHSIALHDPMPDFDLEYKGIYSEDDKDEVVKIYNDTITYRGYRYGGLPFNSDTSGYFMTEFSPRLFFESKRNYDILNASGVTVIGDAAQVEFLRDVDLDTDNNLMTDNETVNIYLWSTTSPNDSIPVYSTELFIDLVVDDNLTIEKIESSDSAVDYIPFGKHDNGDGTYTLVFRTVLDKSFFKEENPYGKGRFIKLVAKSSNGRAGKFDVAINHIISKEGFSDEDSVYLPVPCDGKEREILVVSTLQGEPTIKHLTGENADSPTVFQTLVAEHGITNEGFDENEIGVIYKWYVGDQVVQESTDNTYRVKADDFGKSIKVEINALECYQAELESMETGPVSKAVLLEPVNLGAELFYGQQLSEAHFFDSDVYVKGATDEVVEGTWHFEPSDDILEVDNAQSYTATFTPSDNSNLFESLEATIVPIVHKADRDASSYSETVQSNYEASDEVFTYDLSKLDIVDTLSGFEFKILKDSQHAILNNVVFDNEKKMLTFNIKSVSADTTDKAVIVAGAKNYNDFDVVIEFKAVDRTEVAIEGISIADKEYDGKAISFEGAPTNNNGYTGDYLVKYISTDGRGYDSEEAPVNAGAYKLVVSVPKDNKEYVGSLEKTFNINRKKLTIKPSSHTITEGDAMPEFKTIYEGLVEGDEIEAEIYYEVTTKDGQTVIENTSKDGTYVVNYGSNTEFTGNPNYEFEFGVGELVIREYISESDDSSSKEEETKESQSEDSVVTVEIPDNLEANDDGVVIIPEDEVALASLGDGIETELPAGTEIAEDGKITVGQEGLKEVKLAENTVVDLPSQTVIESDGLVIIPEDGEAEVTLGSDVELNLLSGTEIKLDDSAPLGYVVQSENVYEDVPSDSWYEEDAVSSRAHQLFKGTSENPPKFSPKMPMNRAMIVTVLHRMTKEKEQSKEPDKSYSDVDDKAYYGDAVNWASKNGIVNGYSSGKFGTTDAVSREQLAAMVYRFATLSGKTSESNVNLENVFSDSEDISLYSKKAIEFCVQNGILHGRTSGEFDPRGEATRAEVAVVINRLINYFAK